VRQIQLTAPSIQAVFPKLFTERLLQIDTAPRAGQSWTIGNVYFRFPEAVKQQEASVGNGEEFEFEIRMFIGGVEVASQKFIEFVPFSEKEESPFHIQGSLEPYAGAIVYPGQDVHFTYSVQKSGTKGAMISGLGNIVLNYTLNV